MSGCWLAAGHTTACCSQSAPLALPPRNPLSPAPPCRFEQLYCSVPLHSCGLLMGWGLGWIPGCQRPSVVPTPISTNASSTAHIYKGPSTAPYNAGWEVVMEGGRGADPAAAVERPARQLHGSGATGGGGCCGCGPAAGGQQMKAVLLGVSGVARCGELVGVLGPSGLWMGWVGCDLCGCWWRSISASSLLSCCLRVCSLPSCLC